MATHPHTTTIAGRAVALSSSGRVTDAAIRDAFGASGLLAFAGGRAIGGRTLQDAGYPPHEVATAFRLAELHGWQPPAS